eukprot:Rmarinus@m.13283
MDLFLVLSNRRWLLQSLSLVHTWRDPEYLKHSSCEIDEQKQCLCHLPNPLMLAKNQGASCIMLIVRGSVWSYYYYGFANFVVKLQTFVWHICNTEIICIFYFISYNY